MNEPTCWVYRAAILPTCLHSCPNPKFNPKTKTKPNTNPIAADATYTELQASKCHPNHLRSPFCTKTRSSTAHQQQIHTTNRISGDWALMSTAVRSAYPRYRYRVVYIHHIATQTAHMYARPACSAPPPPRQPVSLVLSRHGRTDVMVMKDALGEWRAAARCTYNAGHLRAGWPRQCQPTNADCRRGHFQTTLTTGPAGLPHRAT